MEYKSIYLSTAIIPLMILWTLNYFKIGNNKKLVFPENINRPSWLMFVRMTLFLLMMTAFVLIGYSLTQPRQQIGYAKSKIKVNDIFFVVDVSRSMLAEDFRPNRLEAAKEKISEFVSLRPKDRIGLVIFSEKVFTLLPLSTDLELIKRMISEINTDFLGSGTNIGDALALSVGRATQSLAENKVIVLLTDGVSNVGNMTPIQASELAKKEGVKVYTIGIGKKENSRVLRHGRGYQKIPGGSVDLDTLDKIASQTNGKSFYAGDPLALQSVLTEIQELEKTEIEQSGKPIYKEHYYKFLFIGVFLFLFVELIRRKFLKEAV
ncbi:VWA domain-containing protein [Bacteriovoracaceae bacterium]|nr:VWA domain-containing protein [Bacteriovoracaceae bacterium]